MGLSAALARKARSAWSLRANGLGRVHEAWWMLLGADVMVGLVPFRLWRKTLRRALVGADGGVSSPEGLRSDRIRPVLKAFGIALRNHYRSMNCLRRSLALVWMLRRRGVAARMVIGVRRDNGEMAAHAWVEAGGRVVGDRPDVGEMYTRLDKGGETAEGVRHWEG